MGAMGGFLLKGLVYAKPKLGSSTLIYGLCSIKTKQHFFYKAHE
jgi:hypothetical protein